MRCPLYRKPCANKCTFCIADSGSLRQACSVVCRREQRSRILWTVNLGETPLEWTAGVANVSVFGFHSSLGLTSPKQRHSLHKLGYWPGSAPRNHFFVLTPPLPITKTFLSDRRRRRRLWTFCFHKLPGFMRESSMQLCRSFYCHCSHLFPPGIPLKLCRVRVHKGVSFSS